MGVEEKMLGCEEKREGWQEPKVIDSSAQQFVEILNVKAAILLGEIMNLMAEKEFRKPILLAQLGGMLLYEIR
ncbi:uncharacterized protein N7484_004910 [Penicillium longicatenatum]|uniref:uncharacterized protein n=1 Tax=Penicillium longicatenatum TaxID=1561947 RepID=UPI002546D17D|nr:uncharacterized protein N7484_004910 [Penicillium longicatenatum]KAJ5651187.1 hypothetical protein N7484_004910 [Penicillium longicatenatum]